jgi:hypothetical protein
MENIAPSSVVNPIYEAGISDFWMENLPILFAAL